MEQDHSHDSHSISQIEGAAGARYIKLGKANRFAKHCLENGLVCFGFGFEEPVAFQLACLKPFPETELKALLQHGLVNNANIQETLKQLPDAIDKSALANYYRKHRQYKEGMASNITNQAKALFGDVGNVIWTTIHKQQLYWCFIEPESGTIQSFENGESQICFRTQSGWHDTPLEGNKKSLHIFSLAGTVSQKAAFRGTSCGYTSMETQYLKQKLQNRELDAVLDADQKVEQLAEKLHGLIGMLNPYEFEILAEKIFSRLGWQQVTKTGGQQFFFDLDLVIPAAEATACVQAKSYSNPKELKAYAQGFLEYDRWQRFIWFQNTDESSSLKNVRTSLSKDFEKKGKILDAWYRKKISSEAARLGFADWILDRVRIKPPEANQTHHAQ